MVNNTGRVNTKLLFVFNLHYFVKYLFSWEIMPFLLMFSLAFVLMPFNPLIFAIVELLVLLMVYKMAFDVLADVASGHMTPTSKHNYLVSNAVGVKVALLVLLIELSKMWMDSSDVAQAYSQDFVLLITFITPAIYMSLAITNSLPHAMNPLTLFKIIKTSYISYFIFVLFWVASIYLLKYIINPLAFNYLPAFIDGIVMTFIEYSLLLINFQIMGYILYQNRREFGLHEIAGFYPLDEHFVKVEEETKTNPYHQRVKALLADDQVELAMSMIVELQQNGDRGPELTKLYQKTLDKKLIESSPYDIAEKIHFQLEKKQIKRAFDKVVEQLELDKPYVEHSAHDIHPLLKHALNVNKIEYVPKLVENFEEKYPNHMDIVANYFILAKVIYRVRKNRGESKLLLEKLIKNYPNDPMMNQIRAWYQGMKLMEKKPTNL